MYTFKNKLNSIALTVGSFVLFSSTPALATQFNYLVKGNVSAPIMVELNGNTINPGNATYSLDFDSSNVKLTYDDVAGTMSITGSVNGQTTYSNYDPNVQKLSNYHFAVGNYEYELDIHASNPIASRTTGGTQFAFGMQDAGKVTVKNAPASFYTKSYWDDESSVILKNDKDFAFAVWVDPANSNQLIGEGWVALMSGFLGIGNGTRWEFGAKNANLNWNFTLVPTDGTAVPEPLTAGLLSLGLLGAKFRRKKVA